MGGKEGESLYIGKCILYIVIDAPAPHDSSTSSVQAASGVFGTSTFSTLGLTRKAKVAEPPTFVARTIDSLSDVTVKKVACGDLFMACVTGKQSSVDASHVRPTVCWVHHGCYAHGVV